MIRKGDSRSLRKPIRRVLAFTDSALAPLSFSLPPRRSRKRLALRRGTTHQRRGGLSRSPTPVEDFVCPPTWANTPHRRSAHRSTGRTVSLIHRPEIGRASC